jgi:very-short-patch-repair endonuclease
MGVCARRISTRLFTALLVNQPIHDAAGRFLALGDLVYERERIVVEYDGAGHEKEKQYFKDVDRIDGITAEDWRVIRVNRTHAADHFRAPLDKIRRALAARRAPAVQKSTPERSIVQKW